MKINILHFSDFHYSHQHCDECHRTGERLAESTAGSHIDAIIFSGDLVQDMSDDFNQAYDALIEPVRRIHGLTMDRILIVPGNHDKEKSSGTDPFMETLLQSKTEEQVNRYFSDRSLAQASMINFEQFNTFHWSRFGHEDYGGFGHVSVFELSGIKVGLVGLNSSWCSTYSARDRGNLLFPLNAAEKLFEKTHECDIVLTSMHHNLNDFKYFIARPLEEIIQENSHILLTGHYHKQTLNATLTPKGCLLHNVAPTTFDTHETTSSYGYCIITVDTETYEVNSSICHYIGDAFKPVEHLKTTAMMSDRKRRLHELRKTMQRHLGMLEILADSLIPTDTQQREGLTFEELYSNPALIETGSLGTFRPRPRHPVTLKEIEDDSRNVLVTGLRKHSRTALLFKIWMDHLRRYDDLGIIPFYLDCTRYREEKDFFSIEQQLQQFLGQNSHDMTRTFQEKRLLLLIDDFELSNKAFVSSLECSMKYIPGARFIACARADLASQFGELRFNNQDVARIYLKGF